MSGAHFEIYEARPDAGPIQFESEWRWRLRAGNGEIVASGEGYKNNVAAAYGVRAVVEATLAAVVDVPGAIEKVDE